LLVVICGAVFSKPRGSLLIGIGRARVLFLLPHCVLLTLGKV
jgi:hypothetical protein